MPQDDKQYFFISTLARGINILELFSENETLSVIQVARLMDINRASSHRFLSTLKELGYVDKDENSKYYLTSKILSLGMKLLDRIEIRKVAKTHMNRLATTFNETINLGLFNGKNVLTIDKIDSTEILRMDAGVGGEEPAYCTSMGKAILAHLPKNQLDNYLDSIELKALTVNTITLKDKLMKELNDVRKNGYAIDDEELSMGLRCIGAPIFSHDGSVSYAISISGPTIRFGSKKIDDMKAELKKTTEQLSGMMGCVNIENN